MNFSKLGIIIRREYLNKVKKKSFIFITFLAPIFFAALVLLPSLIMLLSKEDTKKIGVVDESGIVMAELTDNESLSFIDISAIPYDVAKQEMSSLGVEVIVHISPLDSLNRSVTAESVSQDPLGVESQSYIEDRINDAVENYRIAKMEEENQLSDLKQKMDALKSHVSLVSYKMDESGNESLSESGILMALSMFLGMAIYMFIIMFCGMVMSSVIEEKSSKVVEVLVSSVKATELMFGKIIGVALVALTQFVMWIVLTLAIVGVASRFIHVDEWVGTASAVNTTVLVDNVDLPVGEEVLDADGPSGLEAIISTLKHLEVGKLLFAFFLYFIFGYLLYASLFAAIGSAVENEADTQQLQIPVTAPLFIGFFIALYAFKAPGSGLVWWGSMIPFTSPIVMLARIPLETVPMWELLLSVGLLILTFLLAAWLSAKIYQVGVLMFGKKSTFKDLWRWIRQK